MSRLRTIGMVVISALLAATAQADYRDTYRNAIKAVDQESWPHVRSLMRSCMAEKAAEGELVHIFGSRKEAYLPSYYLGLAHFHLGDCQLALQAWDMAERRGAVQGTSAYAELRSKRSLCQPRLSTIASPTPRPAPRVSDTATPEPGPASDLHDAVYTLLDARYQECLEELAQVETHSSQQRTLWLLVSSAAHYALYLAEGDLRYRSRALADARECRRLDPLLIPDARYFSPGFIELFESVELAES